MQPLTNRVPKALIPILDVPLIDLALAHGSGIEWESRFVNVSHLAEPLHAHLRNHPDVEVLDEGDEPLGTAGTLRYLLPKLAPLVVTYNCDLVSDISLLSLLDAHERGARPCTLAVRAVEDRSDFVLEGERFRFVDRREDSGRGFSFLGAACFDRELLTTIGEGTPLGLAEGLLRTIVDDQEVTMYEHRGYALDVGTIARYLQASFDALGALRGGVWSEGSFLTVIDR